MRGQIALEYLLVFTIVAAAFAFIAAKAIPQYKLSMEKMEAAYAKRVLLELKSAAEGLDVLADGSSAKIEVNPTRPWTLSTDSFGLYAQIENGEEVSVYADSLFCGDVIMLEGKSSIFLEKRHECIAISQQ